MAGLKLVEEDMPSPGPGEVLVKVKASSLNFRDFVIINGWFPAPVTPGRIPLSDGAGEIAAVGDGVRRFAVGDRVVNAFYPNWFGGSLNGVSEQYVTDHDGWLSEYRVVSAEALSRLPDHLSFEEGATLACAGTTAWTALAGIGSGDTVLTQGTGGVSLFAVQFAKAAGARVIATTSSAAKAERLKLLGADEVIDYAANPEWGATVRALTGGVGVDRIVEVSGPTSVAQSIKAVRRGGQISLIGILGGAQGSVDYMSIFLSFAHFVPISVGSRRDLEDMIRVINLHKIKPVIDSQFSFDNAQAAFDKLAQRQLFGKIVVSH
jgi:NADPH:quinone reductase-like Zn-dependent oxidoreductase